MSILKQIKVGDIIDGKYKFKIPSNQRGFRWESQQITELLNDIISFKESGHKPNDFYCLQPLVVQKNKLDSIYYDVVDGQQRLTTIYIIASYVKYVYSAAGFNKDLYSLDYETRTDSASFLTSIFPISTNQPINNVDFFYMHNAAKVIKEWFEIHKNDWNFAMSFFSEIEKNVQFIWYELDDNDDAHEIFARINRGKILLTDAELIKAILLNRNNFSNTEQFQMQKIASEWDNIEAFFANNDFWYFIANLEKYTTRIDLLFILFNDQNNKKADFNHYKIFNNFLIYFNEQLEINNNDKNKTVNIIWEKISEYYENLKDWYLDNTLFHRIGFLIDSKVSLSKISFELFGKKKDEIKKIISDLITERINLSKTDFYQLQYGDQNLKQLLLLFNIETIVRGAQNIRFNFEKYKDQSWDIEHIHAKADEPPNKAEEIKSWWENYKKNWSYLQNAFNDIKPEYFELKTLIGDSNSDEILAKDVELFKRIYNYILATFDENSDDNVLGNLTLLNSKINRAYKNAVFAVKRQKIIEEDTDGAFIPPCTKNVFLKYYSKNPGNMFCWSKEDQQDYAGNILPEGVIFSVIKEYLK